MARFGGFFFLRVRVLIGHVSGGDCSGYDCPDEACANAAILQHFSEATYVVRLGMMGYFFRHGVCHTGSIARAPGNMDMLNHLFRLMRGSCGSGRSMRQRMSEWRHVFGCCLRRSEGRRMR